MSRQTNQYDKIFKENIEAVIPSLMQNVLGIVAVESEEIPDDVQHTKERKPDVLKKITDSNGALFILQIEFQVADESEMIYRMAEYYIMLERRYKLPIRQFVIFLGAKQPDMPTQLSSDQMQFNFPLILFAELDYKLFLQSDRPEEVILSILGNYKGESTEQVVRRVLYRIEETTRTDFSLQRHLKQLRVLAQLRNLSRILKTINMDDVSKIFSVEKDLAYMIGYDKGEEKGEKKAQTRVIANLLAKMSLTVEQIADIAGVSVEFVKQVQQKQLS